MADVINLAERRAERAAAQAQQGGEGVDTFHFTGAPFMQVPPQGSEAVVISLTERSREVQAEYARMGDLLNIGWAVLNNPHHRVNLSGDDALLLDALNSLTAQLRCGALLEAQQSETQIRLLLATA